jgi:hypothetical protein
MSFGCTMAPPCIAMATARLADVIANLLADPTTDPHAPSTCAIPQSRTGKATDR